MSRTDAKIYLGLIHHPIYNKNGKKITTTITNLDLHDIARVGKTYDVERYFVINHLKSQQALVKRMQKYWTSGFGSDYNENRHDAFAILEVIDSLADTIDKIEEETGKKPELIATDANPFSNSKSYNEMREFIYNSEKPFLLIFGTGWGLTEDTLDQCHHILEPVYGRGEFNHLSVRSAASIIMDRLLSAPWWEQD